MKTLFIVGFVVLVFALSFGISAAVGWGISWVLSHFGVHVAWYVCSVAVFLLGFVVRNIRGTSPA